MARCRSATRAGGPSDAFYEHPALAEQLVLPRIVVRRSDGAHVPDGDLGGLGRQVSLPPPFQWIDITGLPGGTYAVRAMPDPHDRFLETDGTDGSGWTQVRFGSSGTSVSVVSSGRGCINDWHDTTFEPPLPPTDQDFFDGDDGVDGEGSINRMAAAGITGGCWERRYCPERSVTREEMAAFLVRALQFPPPVEPDHFVDDDTSPSEAYIDSLFESGITTGCSAGRFCAGSDVTRGQMAAFLYRGFAEPAPEG